MTTVNLWLFALTSALLIVVPGPNVMVIVGTSLAHGRVRGLQTVAGTSTAMLLQLAVAAVGTSGLVLALSAGFAWLKWLGVGYLVWVGLGLLLRQDSAPVPSGMGSFRRGFWVSLTNPKTILFFGAFLPQFVVPGEPYLPQVALLSVVFWVLAVCLDSGYALMAAGVARWLRRPGTARWLQRTTGVVYLGAGTALAGSRL